VGSTRPASPRSTYFLARGVEAEIAPAARYRDAAIGCSIFRDLTGRGLQRAFQDLNAGSLVPVAGRFLLADRHEAAEQAKPALRVRYLGDRRAAWPSESARACNLQSLMSEELASCAIAPY